MDVIVRGKHFDVPDHVAERARRKLGKLPHYLPLLEDAAVEVDLAHEKAKEPDQRYVARVKVSARGVHLQAAERAAKPEAAVDQAAQALTRQAQRHKQRLYRRGRPASPKALAVQSTPQLAEELEEEPAQPEQVARVKRFSVKPMTAAEALEQMRALRHDFFLFHDADLGQFALLYRRRDGDYGLIIPELS